MGFQKTKKRLDYNKTQKLLEDFLDYLEVEKNRSQKTRQNYQHYLERFFAWAKIRNPQEITLDLVRKFRLYLNRLQDNQGASLKKITQNYHIIALRSFLKYLAKRDIKSLSAEKIELGKTPERQIEFLEEEELERLLSTPSLNDLSGLRDKAILELLFSTGLRVSELVSLDRDKINLNKGEFSVKGKGGKVRVVFLSSTAKKALEEYLKKRDDADLALFVQHRKAGKSLNNLRLTARSIQRIVKKYAKAAGLTKDIHTHTLRHSFATDLLMGGADLRSVQALLGHSSITTTQIYTHITDKQLKEVHQAFHARRRKKK